MMLRSLLIVVVLALSAASGCGDDTAPPGAGVDAGPRVDAGPSMDSGSPPTDGGAGTDGAVGDGGLEVDGGAGCTLAFDPDMDVLPISTDTEARSRIVPVASSTNGFVVVWTETDLGIPDVFGRQLAPDGRLQAREPLTSDAARSLDPTVIAVGTDYLLGWVDNSEGGFEVYAQSLGGDLTSPGTKHRLTDNSDRDDSPALLANGDGVLAAWVFDDSTALTRTAHTRQLSGSGEPSAAATPVSAAGQSPSAPILVPRSGGTALVWAESGLTDADVILLPLGPNGGSPGSPVTLNTEGNANGTVDAAMTESGGAVVFGASVGAVRQEVRFQAVTGTGARFGDEIPLTLAPEAGRDASIVSLGGGYVVAYRALEDDDLTEPTLRVTTLSGSGDRLGTVDVTPVTAAGGRTSIHVSPDGSTLFVAWADLGDSETSIRAARLSCE